MADDTPVLRADATDDDLQEEAEPQFGDEVKGRPLSAQESNTPEFAKGGLIEHDSGPYGDSVPVFLSGCYYVLPKHVHAAEDHAPGDRQHHIYGNDHTHEPEA